MNTPSERSARLDCFGGHATVLAGGPGDAAAIAFAAARLRDLHAALSRFLPASDLCLLNRDPRTRVPAGWMLRRFAAAVPPAGALTGGLVDATQVGAIEAAGYRGSRAAAQSTALREALAAGPARRAAQPDPARRWELVDVDDEAGTVTRPPGVRLDSGGLGKGLAADLAAGLLARQATFAVDCAGDLRIGGTAGRARRVEVADPFGGPPLHRFHVSEGAVATSGISRRSWLMPEGRPAHHLLDPRTGRPAFTGVVQATALAPTALEAEARAKAALLTGPEAGAGWLAHGGALVFEDGSASVVDPESVAVAA